MISCCLCRVNTLGRAPLNACFERGEYISFRIRIRRMACTAKVVTLIVTGKPGRLYYETKKCGRARLPLIGRGGDGGMVFISLVSISLCTRAHLLRLTLHIRR